MIMLCTFQVKSLPLNTYQLQGIILQDGYKTIMLYSTEYHLVVKCFFSIK
jgi:hypothetical protein